MGVAAGGDGETWTGGKTRGFLRGLGERREGEGKGHAHLQVTQPLGARQLVVKEQDEKKEQMPLCYYRFRLS